MHERVEVDVPGVLLAVVIVVLVSLGLVHQVRLYTARQVEVRKIQQILAAESERAEEEAVEEYTSMRNSCVVCQTPTNTRCSRCKAVHYCSSACQLKDWRQGHKDECKLSRDDALQAQGNVSVTSRKLEKAVETSEVHVDNTQTVQDRPTKQQNCRPAGAAGNHTRATQQADTKIPCTANGISKVGISNATSDGCLTKPRKILFPYDRFVKFFNFDCQRPPCGLINCGNSCFANVILQCLCYTRPLAAFLLEGTHRRECRRNDWCFMCELQDHVWRVFNSQVPFSPIRILSRLRNIGNHLGYGRQEDAHEFMRFAVDSMQSICLDEFGGEKSVDPRSQETTLIQYIFGGHLQSQVKCMKCGHESNRYENMMDLAVEIQGAVESLEDGLAQFTAPEWLDGENKYKCDRCNGYVKASKRLTIHEAPNILTIALKRFQSGKFGKINKRVTFPEVLNMSPYMSGEGDKPPIYRLYAVVVHVDMLNASFFGHYICYVRDMEGTWYKIDDSKVKEVESEKVMAQKAYMLIYRRSLARPSPEADTGSVASSLMDVSVARSTLPCKYQRASSSIHGEVHRIRPIIAGTLVDDRLVEDVGEATADDRLVVFDGPSISNNTASSSLESETTASSQTPEEDVVEMATVHQNGLDKRRIIKRRLELEESPSLRRSRSSSCPPVARTPSTSMDTYQLADDLPRTFGYSLHTKDRVSEWECSTPPKRQHLAVSHVGKVEDRKQVLTVDVSNGSSQCSIADELEQGICLSSSTSSQARQGFEVGDVRDFEVSEQVSVESVEQVRPLFAKGFLNRRN